jgi:16S rRNA (cytosine967-C5)-methyltransferase
VLRRSFRAPLLLPEGDDAASLAVTYSHPQWLVERWLQRFDVETTISMMQASNAPPPVWVRVRKGASSLPWTDADVQETALDGLFVRLDGGREALLNSASFARGDISFQDPSSGEAALRLVPYLKPGQILVDLCSAPGGKIACLRDAGLLTGIQPLALDLSMVRQQRTRSGFQRLGLKATVAVSDGVEPPVKPSSVDAILLDAPCSNLGVLGRRPEARWRVVPRELAEHALLQKQLLAKALELLKPGGVVVYSTCSVEPEETEQVVASVSETCEVVEQFTRLPTPGGWDGFFAAVLRKS